MRILRRKEFLALPAGTIYAKGKEWYFNGLEIKHETTGIKGDDWWSLDPAWIEGTGDGPGGWFDTLEKMLETGASHPMDDSISRDGYFESDALFLIFEKGDLLTLREFIDRAIELHEEKK